MNRKIQSTMASLMKLALICLTFPVLVACSNDKDIPDYYVREADYYRFLLYLEVLDTSTDQQDLIATTYSYVDAEGKTFSADLDFDRRNKGFYHLSDTYTEFPSEIEITVTQDLRPGVVLNNGATYQIGLGITLKVAGMKGLDVVSETESAGLGTREINGADASVAFPIITKFKIIADKKGYLTVEKTGNN